MGKSARSTTADVPLPPSRRSISSRRSRIQGAEETTALAGGRVSGAIATALLSRALPTPPPAGAAGPRLARCRDGRAARSGGGGAKRAGQARAPSARLARRVLRKAAGGPAVGEGAGRTARSRDRARVAARR